MKNQHIPYSSAINDMIFDIKRKDMVSFPKKGSAESATDFFNQIIKWQFQHKATIQAIHKALLEYVKRPDAVFAIRLYGSAPRGKYFLLRRGFLSEYQDGLKTFFCDNTFSMPFAALKLYDKCYTASDLVEHLSQKNVVCGFKADKEERKLAYYKCNSYSHINLNDSGWYLAHILPVGYNFAGKQRLTKVFPNPKRAEWELDPAHIRRVDRSFTENEYAVLVAHFLRLVHPLNSFVIPKKNYVAYDGKNLGEEQELINIVQDYVKAEFPEEYAELQTLMQIPEQEKVTDTVGKIHWSVSEYQIKNWRKEIFKDKPKKASKKRSKTVIDQYDEDKAYALDNRLRSVGNATFMKLYPLVKQNPDITVEEVEKVYTEYKKGKAENAKRTCLSSTCSIIRNGYEAEALEIIVESSKTDDAAVQAAKKYLEELYQKD